MIVFQIKKKNLEFEFGLNLGWLWWWFTFRVGGYGGCLWRLRHGKELRKAAQGAVLGRPIGGGGVEGRVLWWLRIEGDRGCAKDGGLDLMVDFDEDGRGWKWVGNGSDSERGTVVVVACGGWVLEVGLGIGRGYGED